MATRICVVPNCRNVKIFNKSVNVLKEEGPTTKVSYYSFPTNPFQFKQWIEAIGKPGFKPHSRHRVCSEHFHDEDFEPDVEIPSLSLNRRILTRGVVPSRNLPGIRLQEEPKAAAIGVKELKEEDVSAEEVVKFKETSNRRPEYFTKLPGKVLRFCLLCSENVESFKMFEFCGAVNMSLVNQQLWNTFILRKVLKYSHAEVQHLLKNYGVSKQPGDWFDVCKNCSEKIYEIAQAHNQILQLKTRISKLHNCLKKAFESSVVNKDNEIFKKASAALEIRNHLRRVWQSEAIIKLEPRDDDDFELGTERIETEQDEAACSYSSFNPVNEVTGSESSNFGNHDEEEQIMSLNIVPEVQIDPLTNNIEWLSKKKPKYQHRPSVKSTSKKAKEKRKYKCMLCHNIYCSPLTFKRHQALHQEANRLYEGRLNCHLCKFPFLNTTSLRHHLHREHRLSLHVDYNGTGKQEDYVYTNKTRKQVFHKLRQNVQKKEQDEVMKGSCTANDETKEMEGMANGGLIKTDDDIVKNEPEEFMYECKICPRKYNLLGMFKKHQRDHDRSQKEQNGKFDCCLCRAPFLKTSSLTLHFTRAHKYHLSEDWDPSKPQEECLQKMKKFENGKFQCIQCPATLKSPDDLKNHLELHKTESEENFNCPECNFPSTNATDLENHINLKHRDTRCTCHICGFVAKTPHKLKEHVYYHKIYDDSVDPSISKTEFVCSICKDKFITRKRLLSHKVKLHAEELGLEGFKCEECSHFFMRKDSLIKHKISKHGHKSRFFCDQCGYGTSSRSRLTDHMETHSSTKNICEHCSACYSHRSSLRHHIRTTHPEHYPQIIRKNHFQGVQIPKLVTDNDSNPVVKNTKTHMCKYCDSVFYQKAALTNHLRSSHSYLYTFQCDLCDDSKVFMSKASLQLHQKTKHGSALDKVRCDWCQKAFNHRFYLYSHKRYCQKKPINCIA